MHECNGYGCQNIEHSPPSDQDPVVEATKVEERGELAIAKVNADRDKSIARTELKGAEMAHDARLLKLEAWVEAMQALSSSGASEPEPEPAAQVQVVETAPAEPEPAEDSTALPEAEHHAAPESVKKKGYKVSPWFG